MGKYRLCAKSPLYFISLVLSVFALSFPLLSPLIFFLFLYIFQMLEYDRPVKQLAVLFSLYYLVSLVIFTNSFFVIQYRLLLTASLYFSVLITFELFTIFCLVRHKFALLLIFCYVVLSRISISVSMFIFPFYWTMAMQLLPIMNTVSRFLLPVFVEGICVVFAVAVHLLYKNGASKKMFIHVFSLVLCGIILTYSVKTVVVPQKQQTGLQCTIIQGGYSAGDYSLIEKYPILTELLVQKYLTHLKDIRNARFLILPESALPLPQKRDGDILRSIEEISLLRNEYILASVHFEEGENKYNAVFLINPQGRIQNIYAKKNPVLFIETSKFKQGYSSSVFEVDNYKVAPLICFDSVFICNYFREDIPDIYIVTSNDVFAEKTVLSQMHQAYSVINSRTVGIPLLQLTQNGPSFFVDSGGKLTTLTKPYERAVGLTVTLK
jgi:apolipoprotein N-acyltransferase